jgi:hypothetical protein
MSNSNASASRPPSTEVAPNPEPAASDALPQRPVDPYGAPLPDANSGNQMSPAIPLIGILVFTVAVIIWGAMH